MIMIQRFISWYISDWQCVFIKREKEKKTKTIQLLRLCNIFSMCAKLLADWIVLQNTIIVFDYDRTTREKAIRNKQNENGTIKYMKRKKMV